MGKRRLQVFSSDDEAPEIDGGAGGGGSGEEEVDEEEAMAAGEDAKPVGEVLRVTGKGRRRKRHYGSFEYNGYVFELEDPVLLTPEDTKQKPYVAIIKDITQDPDDSVMVTGQWFYRPEEAERKGGGSWQARDTRELFYSFHLDEVPAESVIHKCIVHFVPLNKHFPIRSQHPGFIVQKIYDTIERKLWKLTDGNFEDSKQHEINMLIQKTRERVGELPDIVEDARAPADHEDLSKSKCKLRRRNTPSIDVEKDDGAMRSDRILKVETPGSFATDVSEYHAILVQFNALTGDSARDRWLEKLLQGIQLACEAKKRTATEDMLKGGSSNDASAGNNTAVNCMDPKESSNNCREICWPDAAVLAITALEKVTYEALGSEYIKYNQKMRKLDFNLKNNVILAKRLLNKELEPVVILSMSPDELKDGLTAEEKATKEPEKTRQLQMTDARCSRCMEKKVGVSDIIHAGGHGNRYQLECIACGHTWYASQDVVSSLTVNEPTVVKNVGTAPWATAKFEDVEKKLVNPRETNEEPADLIEEPADLHRKSTGPHGPVLEKQKSINK